MCFCLPIKPLAALTVGTTKDITGKIYCPFPSKQGQAILLIQIHMDPEEMIRNGTEKSNSKHQWEIAMYVLSWKQWKTPNMEGTSIWLFVHIQADSLKIPWGVQEWYLPCVLFFITVSHYPFWVHSNLSPLFLDPLPLLVLVAGRESMVMPILPLLPLGTAGTNAWSAGLCPGTWGSWNVSLHLRWLYFKTKFMHITLEQTYKRILKLRPLV